MLTLALRRTLILSLPLVATTTAAAQSFLVDAGGAGDFLSIQAAVQAVPDGSTLRLLTAPDPAAESYDSISVNGKSLSFEGLGSVPVLVPWARVRDLAAGQTVSFRNIQFRERYGQVPRLEVSNCAGTVRVHDCELMVEDGASVPLTAILEVTHSANVTLDGCVIDGASSSRPAAILMDSRVTATRTSFIGGLTPRNFNVSSIRDGETGTTGVELRGRSFAWLGACHLEGGEGESMENAYSGMGWGYGGDGGTGLKVGPSAVCARLDTTVVGGAPGLYWLWSQLSSGNPGAPGVAIDGAVQDVPGQQRTLDAMHPVHSSDEPIHLRVEGLPGEQVTLYGSRSMHFRFLGALFGVFGLSAPDPALTFHAGAIPAWGVLEFDFDPALPTGASADRFDLQAICSTSPSRFRVTNVESMVRLDPSVVQPELLDRIYVDPSASSGGDGSSWSEALTDLEHAMRVAGSSASRSVEIWIAEGRFVASTSVLLPGEFILKDGLRLIGGFPAGGGTLGDRSTQLYPAILDADRHGDDGPGFTQRSDNANNLLRPSHPNNSHPLPELTGVHIDGLWLRGVHPGPGQTAAIRAAGDLTVQDCRFVDNHGSAIHARGMTHVRNCVLEESVVSGFYVGSSASLAQYPSHLTVEGCLFLNSNNLHGVELVETNAATVTVTNCTFRYCGWIPPVGVQCPSTPRPLVNCHSSALEMSNCVFWDNSCGADPLSYVAAINAPNIRYCCFEALPPQASGSTNQTLDPQFVSATDPSLSAASPYIDAGDNAVLAPDFIRDLAGGWRVVDDLSTPGTGPSGTARIVDLGAFEFQP